MKNKSSTLNVTTQDRGGVGGGAFPTMAYTERLRRKGYHFQASVISKGRNSGIHELKYMKG